MLVSVQDRGIGIPKPEQKKIFEKFYRAESSLVHTTKGSGLGLALVRHIMEAHGGSIEVASAPGEGSTFTLVLPLRIAARAGRNGRRSARYDDEAGLRCTAGLRDVLTGKRRHGKRP